MGEKHKFTYQHGGAIPSDGRAGAASAAVSESARAASEEIARSIAERARQEENDLQAHSPAHQDIADLPDKTHGKKTTPSAKNKKSGGKGGKRRSGLLIAIAAVLVVAVTVAGLQLTGFVNLFGGAQQYYTYTVGNQETLMLYLTHPSFKSGDTLELGGSFTVDVEADFGGFASLPLFNCRGGSLTFQGGTVLLSSGESSIDMSNVSFSGTELYVEAPQTSLKLGSADDTNINVKNLNGVSHTRALELPFVGTKMTVPVTFTNVSGGALSDVSVHLTSGGFLFIDSDTVTIDSLAAGASVTMEIPALAIEAGRLEIIGYAVDGAGNRTVEGTSGYINVRGAGYYAGDLHTHTVNSDSIRYGTVQTNVQSGYDHGMSWIASVEHEDEAEVRLPQNEVDSLVGAPNAFLQFPAAETGDTMRHMLIYNSDLRPRSDYGEMIFNFGIWTYQEAINEVIADGGIVIMPHFYEYDITESITLSNTVRYATAVEILTLNHNYTDTEIRYPINCWIVQNKLGRGKLFGIFSSNGMYAEDVGTRYIKGYMPILNEDNLYSMLQSGNYFMSNGPEMRFTLAGANMGGDVYATGAEGTMLTARVYGSDSSPLTAMRIIRYDITGSVDSYEGETVYEADYTGQGIYSIYEEIDLPVVPNSFYRVEINSESARNYEDVGVALSNPVYVRSAQNDSFVHIDSIQSTLGTKIETAPNGTLYIRTDKNISAGNIRVESNGYKTMIEYHDNGGVMADYITVTILADDRTVTVQKIYIFN